MDTTSLPRFGPGCGPGMVLPRKGPATLWGWAEPGTAWKFSLGGQTVTARAGGDGAWTAGWRDLPPGGPHTLLLDGRPLFHDVWVGDLWLLGGQSNIERNLIAGAYWPTDPLALQGDPGIRQLCLTGQFDFVRPRDQIPGAQWIGADTPEVGRISAVGFHFARELRARTGVPQGLILTAMGGSTAQAWLSAGALEAFPDDLAVAREFGREGYLEARLAAEARTRDPWYGRLEAEDPKDPARAGSGPWKSVDLPAFWKDTAIGDIAGSVWFRREFTLEGPVAGEARLRLGTLVDADDAWVNGTWVGATGYQYPTRRYPVPAGVLKPGPNTLLVRIVAPRAGGAFTPGKEFRLWGEGFSVDLAGRWDWRAGTTLPVLPADTFLPLFPLGLHNGMLAPLAPLGAGLSGVLWYQGESNVHGGPDYRDLFQALTDDWRRLFGRPDLPFLVAQLPLFGEESEVADEGWSWVRDGQRRSLSIDRTALAVTLDLGEWNDIHPAEKRDVGLRLALAARQLIHGENLDTWTGPLYQGHVREGGALRVTFTQVGTGLSTRDGGVPGAFFVAGADGVDHRAEARIEGAGVVVSSPLVPDPVRVRYAWAPNPARANLVNSLGLPASPFQAP